MMLSADQWRRSLEATTLKFTPELVKAWRKEFLTLMSNIRRVKDFEGAEKWAKGAVRWGRYLESQFIQVRDDLKTRLRQNKYKEWGQKVNEDWANYYDTHQEPVWNFLSELRSPPTRESWTMEREIENARTNPYAIADWGDGDPEKAVQHVLDKYYVQWKEEARKWDQRARQKARAAWKLLTEWAEWTMDSGYYGGGGEAAEVIHAEKTNLNISGLSFQLVGFEGTDWDVKSLERTKDGVAYYVQRARRVFPWLLKHQLPVVAYFSSAADPQGPMRDAAATYRRDHIALTTWGIGGNKDRFAEIMAHEMGHHIFRTVLSSEARKDWQQIIQGDYKQLDLREVLKQMRPGESTIEFDSRIEKEDPVLHLQLWTLLYSNAYSRLDLLGSKRIQEYLDGGGDPIVRVPTHPVTAYGGKNYEEAFCEVLGQLVGYGPRTVLPEVKAWFKAFVPNVKLAKTFNLNIGDPVLYGKYKNKKGVIKSFKTGPKGDPIVVIEPVPKGRKQDKEVKLFRIRYDSERAEKEATVLPNAEWGKLANVGITRLVMFDFDGTLFRGAEFTPEWWADPTPFSWGSHPISMKPPCVPHNPGSEYWNGEALRALKSANADPNTQTLLVTGRIKAHRPRVRELLKQQGVSPKVLHFNPGMSAVRFKQNLLATMIAGLPDVDTVEIWENENLRAYESYIDRVGDKLGRDIQAIGHLVQDRDIPYECTPQDLPNPPYPVVQE